MLNYQGIAELLKKPKIFKKIRSACKTGLWHVRYWCA